MSESPTPRLYGLPHRWLVPLLLAVFFLAGALSLRGDSATFDETPHLAAGFTYLDRWDFRLNPEHPPLAKLWAALPVWLDGSNRADYGSRYWNGAGVQPGTTMRSRADQWTFGFEFLNGPRRSAERLDPAQMLVPARLAMLAWGVALGLMVFGWARELWGSDGALLALSLYCLSPTLLAHSRLVTTDMPVAFGFTATLWCFWRFTRQPGRWRGTLVGVALAAAMLIKFSSLLLGPLLVMLALLWVYWPGPERWERAGRSRIVVYVLVGAALVAYAGVWGGYGLRYVAVDEPTYQLDWEIIDLREGIKADIVERALAWKILPQAYIYGLTYALGGAERRLAFLNGEESIVGWWYYFPEAFLLKTPPSLLLLLAIAIAAGLRRHRRPSFDACYLALPVIVYFAVSMTSRLNIGHRHLTAIYPLLFVAAGGLFAAWDRSRLRTALLAVLLAGYALSFAAATPGYLSYFNFAAGGSEGGWRYLLDSNVDWGQDLGRLKRWMDDRGVDRVHLAYFGTADPRAYGIEFRKTHLMNDYYPELPRERPGPGEYLAVSVNLLQGLYTDRLVEFGRVLLRRGWVRPETLDQWASLRDELSRQGKRHPDLADWLVSRGAITPEQREAAEAGLLATWLARVRDGALSGPSERRGEPLADLVGKAGDSIFVFRMR